MNGFFSPCTRQYWNLAVKKSNISSSALRKELGLFYAWLENALATFNFVPTRLSLVEKLPQCLHCNLTRRKGEKINSILNPMALHCVLLLRTFSGTQGSSVSSFNYFGHTQSYIFKLTDAWRFYSFKMFLRFWLIKTTRLIHHNQLLLTKCEKNLCHIEPMTSKVQPAVDY